MKYLVYVIILRIFYDRIHPCPKAGAESRTVISSTISVYNSGVTSSSSILALSLPGVMALMMSRVSLMVSMVALVVSMMMSMVSLMVCRVSLLRGRWRGGIVRWRIFWWGCSWCLLLLLLLLLLLRQERLEGGGHGLHPVSRLLFCLEQQPVDVVAGPTAHCYQLGQSSSRGQVRSVRDVGRVLTGCYQVRREDQLGSPQHGAPVPPVVPGQHAVAVQDQLHLLPAVAEPSLCNEETNCLSACSTEYSLVNFLAGPDLTACVDSRTGQSSSPEQRPILTGGEESCCDYTGTMVTSSVSFLRLEPSTTTL